MVYEETCRRLLLMLLKDFFARTRPHKVHTKKFLPKSAVLYSYKEPSIKYVRSKEERGGQGKNVYLLFLRCLLFKSVQEGRVSGNHQILVYILYVWPLIK